MVESFNDQYLYCCTWCFVMEQYYATYFALYCGLLMAFLVIELFAKGTRASSYILGVASFDLVVFIGLLALIIFPGGETNEMHIEHSATLVYKKVLFLTFLSRSSTWSLL
jgi:hypothetical protein